MEGISIHSFPFYFLLLVPWFIALAYLGTGTFLFLRQVRWRAIGAQLEEDSFEPVTLLKPLKGLDHGISENLESFFTLDYLAFDITFSVEDEFDPVIPVVERLMKKYPAVSARLLIGTSAAAGNPKVRNLIRGYEGAANDLLLITDSNARVDRAFLRRFVAQFPEGTALEHAVVSGTTAENFGGMLDAIFLNTFYARGTVFAQAMRHPCVTGKAVLLRKSLLDKTGGIRHFSDQIAEDYMMGRYFQGEGLPIVLSRTPICQHIGSESFSTFWRRHLRWGRIRKAYAPRLVFLSEPFLGSIASGAMGSSALAMLVHVAPGPLFLAHMCAWFSFDVMQMRRLGQRVNAKVFAAWCLRETLQLPLWLAIAAGNTVTWRGQKIRIEGAGFVDPSRALPAPANIDLRDRA